MLIMWITAGALPWIGVYFDITLHPYNVRGPFSKFGALFIVPSMILFALGIILLLVGI